MIKDTNADEKEIKGEKQPVEENKTQQSSIELSDTKGNASTEESPQQEAPYVDDDDERDDEDLREEDN